MRNWRCHPSRVRDAAPEAPEDPEDQEARLGRGIRVLEKAVTAAIGRNGPRALKEKDPDLGDLADLAEDLGAAVVLGRRPSP